MPRWKKWQISLGVHRLERDLLFLKSKIAVADPCPDKIGKDLCPSGLDTDNPMDFGPRGLWGL